MVALYRCRTSLKEVAAMFAADAPDHAEWSAEVWPGRKGLAVIMDGGRRAIVAMKWGLPSSHLGLSALAKGLGPTAWFRELWPKRSELLAPNHRCLIVMEEFAKPVGEAGSKTRNWYGSERAMIIGWPGIWLEAGRERGFCGLLVDGSVLAGPHASMPALMLPTKAAAWLTGDLIDASVFVRSSPDVGGFYSEATEEPWRDRPGSTSD